MTAPSAAGRPPLATPMPFVVHVGTKVHRQEDLAEVARLRACNADGSVVCLAPAVGGRCVEGAGASPVAVERHELLDLQLPLRFGHRALGANGGRRPRCFLSRVDQLEYPDVRNRRRTLLASADNAAREHLTLFQVSLGTVRHEGFLMPRPKPMKTMGPTGRDPPIEIVHFADPWCWWSWGLEPILQRLREVYVDNVQVTYKMGGEFETLKGWMEENGVDERGTVDWILESVVLTHMPLQPDYYFRCKVESSFPACKAFKAATLQSEDKATKYFRRMMEAFGLECLPATEDTLVKLGGED